MSIAHPASIDIQLVIAQAAHVCPAEAELARRAQEMADRARPAHEEARAAAVRRLERATVPELDAERPLRKRALELGPKRAGAHAGSGSAFALIRSGATRTTFQARPTFSSAQITAADGSRSRSARRNPWAAEVGKA